MSPFYSEELLPTYIGFLWNPSKVFPSRLALIINASILAASGGKTSSNCRISSKTHHLCYSHFEKRLHYATILLDALRAMDCASVHPLP